MVPELELVDHAPELVELMVPELELVDHAAEMVELMVMVNPKYPKISPLHRLGYRASTFVPAYPVPNSPLPCRRVSIPFTIGADARTGHYALSASASNIRILRAHNILHVS